MVFGGYIVDADGYRHQLEAIMDPEELDVRGVLTSIGKGSGILSRCGASLNLKVAPMNWRFMLKVKIFY
jgi:hypothetical protein